MEYLLDNSTLIKFFFDDQGICNDPMNWKIQYRINYGDFLFCRVKLMKNDNNKNTKLNWWKIIKLFRQKIWNCKNIYHNYNRIFEVSGDGEILYYYMFL